MFDDISTVQVIVIFFAWLGWITINALVAQAKNISVPGTIAVSIFLSPLVVYLYIAAVPPMPARQGEGADYLSGR